MKPIEPIPFPAISKEEWEKLATLQLKGQSPQEKLAWSTDGLSLEAYYDSSDLEELSYLEDFFSAAPTFNWKLYEEILVSNEPTANEQALAALAGGCDGIVFTLEGSVDASYLLDGVLTDICDISFFDPDAHLATQEKTQGFNYTSSGGSTFLMEAADGGQTEAITRCIQNIGASQHIIRKASPDFFLEISSIRALRFLLQDHLGIDPFSIQIHTSVPTHALEDHQWFLNATAGLASILGGTNSIAFTTASGNSRISRNVGNLIREESGISTYSDQCGGAYFIESMTHQIIQACKQSLK